MAALCRAFGISRDTGHRWVGRYVEADRDLTAVQARSRRPLSSPTKVSPEMEDLLIRARKRKPRWGPRKLRAWLVDLHPDVTFPAASTVGAVLKRHGITQPRRKRRRTTPPTQPFATCTGPNAVWCVDFKGHFRTADGVRVYPLTIMDGYSRFLLRCEGLEEPRGREVQHVFESAFSEFGLPAVIRSDNGPPFATVGAGGLSDLSVWWIRLGIRPERIEPGKPQQNGRHERMHRTLKQETAWPPRASLRAQQTAFDRFRREYNCERPHEALNNETPASAYRPSGRGYPRPSRTPETEGFGEVRSVDALGRFRWGRAKVLANRALRGERVELLPVGPNHWEVRYGPVVLGLLDNDRPGRGLAPRRRARRRLKVAS
jgi:transposase InsO family protein